MHLYDDRQNERVTPSISVATNTLYVITAEGQTKEMLLVRSDTYQTT